MANRKAKIESTIAELVAAFPLAFSTEPERVKPLGIGIKERIYARCILSHREVGAALRRYTGRVAYLQKIIEGAVRVDLDGTASGNVTAKEATHAAEQIKKILAIAAPAKESIPQPPTMPGTAKRMHAAEQIKTIPAIAAPAKGKLPQPPTMPGTSKTGPRRLGLADLRHAAAARRTPKGG